MRRILVLAVLLSVPRGTSAQALGPTQAITVQDSGTSCSTAGTCASFVVGTAPSLTINIAGTYSGTLTFQCLAASWSSLLVTSVATGAQAATTISTGNFAVNNPGCLQVRVVGTTLNSGSATVSATRGYGTAVRLHDSYTIWSDPTSAQTGANTTETVLGTYTLPANTVGVNGQSIRLTVCGENANNGNAKTVQVYFGATSIFIANASTTAAAKWCGIFEVMRVAVASQYFTRVYSQYGGSVSSVSTSAIGENFATDLVIKITGTNGSASAGDIVMDWARLEWL